MKKYCPKCGKPYIMSHASMTHDASGEMLWVAIEDADTCEVSEFEQATEEQVRYLMDGYKVDKHDAARFLLQEDVEGGSHVVYKGIAYKGGFGYNIWVARKYLEM